MKNATMKNPSSAERRFAQDLDHRVAACRDGTASSAVPSAIAGSTAFIR
jgi:hypothetical protein